MKAVTAQEKLAVDAASGAAAGEGSVHPGVGEDAAPAGTGAPAGEERLLHTVHAMCPHCLEVLDAHVYADEAGAVRMRRTCPEHGQTTTYVWPDAEHYEWLRGMHTDATAPKERRAPIVDTCCKSCGLCPRHLRRGTLVEIEVTRRCNAKCPVCFMSADFPTDGISFAQIEDLVATLARDVGPETGLQITGGEPTVRADLPDIVKMARGYGFTGIEVNTNGIVIGRSREYLQKLVDAGITGVYLSFDGTDEAPYEAICGNAAMLADKLACIENCREVGVEVILCMTIVKGVNDHLVGQVIDFAWDNNDIVAGIALQPAFTSGRFEPSEYAPYTAGDTIFDIERQTNGRIRVADIMPLGCSDPLCDTGTFLSPDENGGYVPATRGLTREEYLEYFDAASPQGSVLPDILFKKGVNLYHGVSLIIMNYMDAMTATMERMRECSMLVTMKDGRIIPFCSYQMTDACGRRLYEMWGTGPDE